MPRLAISYRRADSAAISGRIFDRLSGHYGPGAVFMDIDEIPFGIDFREHIAEVLSTCDAVVVVIGLRWLGHEGERRRIQEPTDPVRIEVQAALERRIPVVPVLVDGATMPSEDELPEPLRPLAYRNACPVDTGRDFHAHVDRLIRSMDRILASSGPTEAPAIPPSPAPARSAETPPAAASSSVAGQPLGPALTACLVAFLALPQLVQFSQRTPLFLLALAISTVAVATLLDRGDDTIGRRILAATIVMSGLVIVQSSLALLRASVTDW